MPPEVVLGDKHRPLKVVHVIAGLETAHGGPSYSIPRLCQAVAAKGIETDLYSVARTSNPSSPGGLAYEDRRFAQAYPDVPFLRALRLSPNLSRALREAAVTTDVVHNHGLWLMPNVEAGRAARRAKTPLVVAPRGMLAPAALEFSSAKKRLFWGLLQGPAVRDAVCFHATSEQEYEDIRSFGITRPVAIIPNGIDLPPQFVVQPNAAQRTAIAIGRLHPIKGLDRLLEAWARVEKQHSEWRLRIIGPAEIGYDAELRALAARLGIKRASVENPAYGDEKYAALGMADVSILSSLTESFGIAVADSLAAGTPVISTKGAPWKGLQTERCGWWIDHGIDAMATALEEAMSMSREELAKMGIRGRFWMERDFAWAGVAEKIGALYAWLARGADRPSFVVTN